MAAPFVCRPCSKPGPYPSPPDVASQTPAAGGRLEWGRHGRGFWRSVGGRSDLIAVERDGYWIAHDWEAAGKVAGELADCQGWCENRASGEANRG